jgi:hypothetical protein
MCNKLERMAKRKGFDPTAWEPHINQKQLRRIMDNSCNVEAYTGQPQEPEQADTRYNDEQYSYKVYELSRTLKEGAYTILVRFDEAKNPTYAAMDGHIMPNEIQGVVTNMRPSDWCSIKENEECT